MATHPSEADIVGHTVRQAKRLEDITSVEQLNILEVNYEVNESAGVTGVELVLTVGGPDIRVNALSGTVRGAWGGDTHTTHFDSETVEQYGQMLAKDFEDRHQL